MRQILAAEDVQTLIRQLEEMWLFGQLNTVGDSKVQQQTDQDAKAVADLLKQLAERHNGLASNVITANGEVETTKGS